MKLFFHNDTGILIYSEDNFLNFNSTNPSQWYNITITRELIQFEIIDPLSNGPNGGNGVPPNNFILIFVLVMGGIAIVITITFIGRQIRLREPREKPLKKPLKHNPKIEKRK